MHNTDNNNDENVDDHEEDLAITIANKFFFETDKLEKKFSNVIKTAQNKIYFSQQIIQRCMKTGKIQKLPNSMKYSVIIVYLLMGQKFIYF